MAMTVPQILADMRGGSKQPKSALQKALGKLRKIDRQLDDLTSVARSEDDPVGSDDWDLIYGAIFSSDAADFKIRTHEALEQAGYRFPDYYDPDTTYEADSRAWIGAFKEVLERIEAAAEDEQA